MPMKSSANVRSRNETSACNSAVAHASSRWVISCSICCCAIVHILPHWCSRCAKMRIGAHVCGEAPRFVSFLRGAGCSAKEPPPEGHVPSENLDKQHALHQPTEIERG